MESRKEEEQCIFTVEMSTREDSIKIILTGMVSTLSRMETSLKDSSVRGYSMDEEFILTWGLAHTKESGHTGGRRGQGH